MRFALPLSAAALALALPALAEDVTPPSDAMPLSQILAQIEETGDLAFFEEIEWDDRDGHWEIEYRRDDGARVEMKIDPVSGSAFR